MSMYLDLDDVAAMSKKALQELADLRKEFEALRLDELRLDWLGLVDNTIGNVQLPTQCVLDHPDSLRDAIDAAMAMEAK